MAGLLSKLNVRTLGANFGWLIAERIVRLALGFLVGVLIARQLGPVEFGRLSFAISCVTLIGFAGSLGLDAAAKREIVADPAKVAGLLSSVIVSRITALVLGLLLLVAWLPTLTSPNRVVTVCAAGMLVAPVAGSFDLVLEALLQGRLAFISRSLAYVASAILRLALLGAGASVAAFAAATSIETLLLLTCAAVAVRRTRIAWSFRQFDRTLAMTLLRESWPLIFSSLAVVLYSRIDQVMLLHYAGEKSVGDYSAAVRIAELCYVVPMVLSSTMFPALVHARRAEGGSYRQQGVRPLLALHSSLAYGFTIILSAGAPIWMWLAYGDAYHQGGQVLTIYAWTNLFVFLGVARSHVLTIDGQTRVQLGTTVLGAVVNIGLNAWLIPKWGGIGAAWSTVLAQAIAAWISLAAFSTTRWLFIEVTSALFRPWNGLRSADRKPREPMAAPAAMPPPAL